MTLTFIETREYINQKLKEIYLKLNTQLTKEEKQILEETKTEYEEQSEELEADVKYRIEEIKEKLTDISLDKEIKELLELEKDNLELNFFGDFEEELEESDDIMYELIHFKSWFEGCKTIDEVLSHVDGLKQQLEQFKEEGHELLRPVDTGYCYINKVYQE